MKEFPKGGLIGKVMDAAKTVKQMHIPLHAAYAAYFIILPLFSLDDNRQLSIPLSP